MINVPARSARHAVALITALKHCDEVGTHAATSRLLGEADMRTNLDALVLVADLVARVISDETLQDVAVDVASTEGMVRM